VGVDDAGNVYLMGVFWGGSVTFESTTLTNAGGRDVFIVKYDTNGVLQWARNSSGSGDEHAWSGEVDNNGNVYVTGYITGTAQFGGTSLTSSGGKDVFIAKYDTNGNPVWAKKGGGTIDDEAYGASVDSSGNAYLMGKFSSSTFTIDGTSLNKVGGDDDAFIAKYNSTGTMQWVRKIGGTGGDIINTAVIDADGNVYAGGWFGGSLTIGGATLNAIGNADVLLVKYNSGGILQWAVKGGGTGTDNSDPVGGLAMDSSGHVIMSARIQNTATFGSKSITSPGVNKDDVALLAFDSSGEVKWAVRGGGTENDFPYMVAADRKGNVYTGGYFRSSPATFGSHTLSNTGNSDAFLLKLKVSDRDPPQSP
jgi:hypothetical protein